MPVDRETLIEHYRAMRAGLLEAVEGVGDERLVEQSLDGWSVKDHLAHIALWDEMRAQEVRRVSAGHAAVWRMDGEQERQFGAMAYALRRDLSLAQVRWELEATHRQLLEAIAAASEAGLDGSRYGEAGLVSHHEAQHIGWIKRWRREVVR